ncbi:MAG: PHP domain-containing protein [Thermoanaerobaculales bacterium]
MKKSIPLKKLVIFLVLLLLVITFSPALRFRALGNRNPLPASFSKGVFHVHSAFSDGKGDLEEITAAAAAEKLDFVVLTDHGRPNLEAASATRSANGVTVIGGSELSLEGGHLAAGGFSVPTYRYPPEPQEAIDEVSRDRGISFISHPFYGAIPWTDWSVKDFTGIELINAHTSASRPRFGRLVLVPRFFFRPKFALLTTLEYPKVSVAAWEELNRTGRYSGVFALDAHSRVSVGFGRYVNLPNYSQMFALLTVYVKHGEALGEDAETVAASVVASMRAGSFFNCIEAIAPANGFDAVFESGSGERVEMGGVSTGHSGRLVIHLPFEFVTDVVVRRNGDMFREFPRNKEPNLVVPISDAGVYRVEIFARASIFDDLPWIISNPFFLDTAQARREAPAPAVREVLASGTDFFHVEADPSSMGALVEAPNGEEQPGIAFRYALPEEPVTRDYFAAMVNREARSFVGFDGLTLRVRSPERVRFWLMFRTENDGVETWFRRSFAADHEWSTVSIPFEEFRVHSGEVRSPDLEAIVSTFISIDNQIAYPGASGMLSISDFGLF